ncbi:MAG: hypothetical protein HYV04_16180 [Deltaproteobacteria bacterium]|nr:hypothetical protein [Deltaproteobacteria bacterium]
MTLVRLRHQLVADESAGDESHGSADERAGGCVSYGAADDRAATRSDGGGAEQPARAKMRRATIKTGNIPFLI